jgi:ATP-dependent DNA helicase RecG
MEVVHMAALNELLIAEATEYEFKSELEVKRPKSWLKTVSAFANGLGGSFFFGVDDEGNPVGLADVKATSDQISRLIKERISPLPEFNLTAHRIDSCKDILVLHIPHGGIPPYYYIADGMTTAFVRVGSESNPASPQRLNELVLRGKNLTFDSLPTNYKKSEFAFTVFEASFKKTVKKTLTLKEYVSFGMCNPDGTLTYAGLLFADDCPLLQSRVFCTHWNGLAKGSVGDDAVDANEFEGNIISLLKNSHNFVRLNSKVRWKKMPDHRVDKPDYADRAVFEALANAFMHRDYSVVGSEVHVDMYDDRLDIYSPGGMVDGSLIQELDIEEVPSIRRNPTIADVFHRLDFAERQGSGLRKIREETAHLYGYTDKHAPKFLSAPSAFHVILKNMNYDLHGVTMQVTTQDTTQDMRTGQLLTFCGEPRTRDEMQQFIGIANREHFRKAILIPLVISGKLVMTIPDKPNSRNQKYIRA